MVYDYLIIGAGVAGLSAARYIPVDKKVLAAMEPFFREKFGNPSSIHTFGQEALADIDEARQVLANFLNCQVLLIVFLKLFHFCKYNQ